MGDKKEERNKRGKKTANKVRSFCPIDSEKYERKRRRKKKWEKKKSRKESKVLFC